MWPWKRQELALAIEVVSRDSCGASVWMKSSSDCDATLQAANAFECEDSSGKNEKRGDQLSDAGSSNNSDN